MSYFGLCSTGEGSLPRLTSAYKHHYIHIHIHIHPSIAHHHQLPPPSPTDPNLLSTPQLWLVSYYQDYDKQTNMCCLLISLSVPTPAQIVARTARGPVQHGVVIPDIFYKPFH